MAAVRKAEVSWEGDLLTGKGKVSAISSGAFREQGTSWSARTLLPAGKTGPEELLAAAHASCFAMAFSTALEKAGRTPKKLDVTATTVFDKAGTTWKLQSITLDARCQVPGIDPATLERLAEEAREGSPISQAVKGNVLVTVRAGLA